MPFANVLAAAAGGWHTVFLACAGANILVVIAALGVLRPVRRRATAAVKLA